MSLQTKVVNTYPLPVDCTLRFSSGSSSQSLVPPNIVQIDPSGNLTLIEIQYRESPTGPVLTASIPWGAPIDPNRRLNCIWYQNFGSQIVVIVETTVTGDPPQA